jgi:DNA processing protein
MTETQEDLRFWLALLHAPGVGPTAFRQLLDQYGTLDALFEQRDPCGTRSSEALEHYLRDPNWEQVDSNLAWLARDPLNHILTLRSPAYPVLLRELHDAPPVLFVHGNPGVLGNLQLAIVGSRNPTAGGIRNAQDFAAHLTNAGLTIASGLALGIDAAGHAGALDVKGVTVAVLGTGPDRVYPACHRDLAHQIAEHGALVTELAPGAGPRPEHFPRRNRVISGLSLGTLVVEAAPRSGSLITARHALEQGREVFAIPGSIHNPLARGCHSLIRQGAKLVETADDILEELGALAFACQQPSSARPPPTSLSDDHAQLLDLMGHDPIPMDLLVARTGLTAEAVSSMLLILELQGYIVSAPGGRYSRIDKRL